ncbi:MAG: GNAT family N-acetyltransferase [Thermoleophilia bacterium]|nr:GNAT family N-acetyltransferase [Thermoleophilia bacterium]
MSEVQLDRFRKVVKTKDGSLVVLRPLASEDGEKLATMFASVSESDRRVLKHDVTNKELVVSWAENVDPEDVFSLVAQIDDEIVADATLHRNPGTSMAHVGEIRIVIGRRMRGKGLGMVMLEELLALAEKLGLEQLQAMVPVGSTIAQRAFEEAGFKQEAVFKDYFKAADNRYYDVAVFFLVLKERWEEF